MRSHLIVADQDFTDYIVQDSYNVVSEDVYKSWEDGNIQAAHSRPLDSPAAIRS